MNKNRNRFRCPRCGYGVFTESNERECARCEKKMFFEGKEGYKNDKRI